MGEHPESSAGSPARKSDRMLQIRHILEVRIPDVPLDEIRSRINVAFASAQKRGYNTDNDRHPHCLVESRHSESGGGGIR